MKTIVTLSLTGGTGRTAVAAALGAELAALGHACLLVDGDPQNALGLSLGLPVGERGGLARVAPDDLVPLREGPGRLRWLPFGHCSADEVVAVERAQHADDEWLARRLTAAAPAGTELVLVDTPAGVRPLTLQALRAADLVLVVLRPDGASYATLAALDGLLAGLPREPRVALLVNGLDTRRALDVDVKAALDAAFGDALLPFTIPADEAVREAFARQVPLRDAAPDSQAAAAFAWLASWVVEHAADG